MITGLERFEAALRDYARGLAKDEDLAISEARHRPPSGRYLADELEQYLGGATPATTALREAGTGPDPDEPPLPPPEVARAASRELLERMSGPVEDYDRWRAQRELHDQLNQIVQAHDTRDLETIIAEYEKGILGPRLEDARRQGECLNSLVQEARARVGDWATGDPDVVATVDRGELGEPTATFRVKVGQPASGHRPDFMLWPERDALEAGRCELGGLDDVLDGGDPDSFSDPATQGDYFALIAELKEAGKTSRPGKKLRLFTARPVADRATYEDAARVPGNIFLSDSPDHVEGLAHDLGADEVRDIWEITIREKYVTPTLETPSLKYYQVTNPAGAPIEGAWLVAEGKKP